ncbi:4242_t:CDS:2, partial [Dentiscutata erythropus]
EYVLDDDDDEVASIVEHLTDNWQEEVSEEQIDSSLNYHYHVILKSMPIKRRNHSVSTTGPRRRYNILLFGDSLTAGWVKNADGYRTYQPYGLRVQKRFEDEGLDVEVTVSAVPGECVVQSMEERLMYELEQPVKWYDWVVILGGNNDRTHDVINGYSAWDIFDGLTKLYVLCSKHGARVLGVTIPEFNWDLVNHLDYQRRIVNEHLILTADQRRIYWDRDGVHLTEDGYSLMEFSKEIPLIYIDLANNCMDTVAFDRPSASDVQKLLDSWTKENYYVKIFEKADLKSDKYRSELLTNARIPQSNIP